MKKSIVLITSFLFFVLFLGSLTVQAAETLVLVRDVPVYEDSLSAAAGSNSTKSYPAGTYYIFKRADNGMVNINTVSANPGGWMNPADNVGIAPEPSPQEKIFRLTTATALNFRTGPSTAYPTISQIAYGTTVEILTQVDATWFKILHGGTTGYVSGKYLVPTGSIPQPAPQPSGTAYVTNGTVNFRTGPSTTYAVVAKLPAGTPVEKLGDYNATWSKIKYNSVIGAISSRYLSPGSASLPLPVPVAAPDPSVTPYVTKANVNFRTGPGTSYSSNGILAMGTEVGLISTADNWSKVVYKGVTGYISHSYLILKSAYLPKPKIGLAWTAYTNNMRTYAAEAVVKGGGIVVNLPRVTDKASAEAALNLVDGVVFTGGGDIDPKYYGQSSFPGQPALDVSRINPDRDISDLNLMKIAIARNLPTLGLCRGLQVMNVAAGGSLIQDIPLQVKDPLVHRDPARAVFTYHNISISSGTKLAGLIGGGTLQVNSLHHQAIAGLGSGLTVSARSSDGLIEAVEMADKTFMMGVQFHPEYYVKKGSTKFLTIFSQLIKAAQ